VILTNDGQRGGWSSAEQRNPFFVERAAEELRNAGVPAERIEALPQTVVSTREEAIALRDYATANGFKSLIVVTSAYHSRRALWILQRLFESSGIVIGVEPIPPGEQTAHFATWWLYPSGWRDVAGEYAKLAYYHARY
jgi:uncharacterized SAM-binding protein YcdF (DUF218 family)